MRVRVTILLLATVAMMKCGVARELTKLLVVWEVTQACDLACAHCRVSASAGRDRAELSTPEGLQLLDEIRRFGNPLVVLSGGIR